MDKPSGTLIFNNYSTFTQFQNLTLTSGNLSFSGSTLSISSAINVSTSFGVVFGNIANVVVDNAGVAASSLPGFNAPIDNITIIRTNGVFLMGNVSLNNNLNINTGFLNIHIGSLTTNSFNLSGIMDNLRSSSTSSLAIVGSGTAYTIPGLRSGTRTFRNLSLTNTLPLDVAMPSPTSVHGDLLLNNSVILLGTNNPSVGGSFLGSHLATNMVSENSTGKLVKTFYSSVFPFTFIKGTGSIAAANTLYTPFTIPTLSGNVASSGASLMITEKTTPPSIPYVLDQNLAIKRYWAVDAPGLSNVTASFTVTYTGADLANSGSESGYISAYNVSPATFWTRGTSGEVNTTTREITFSLNGSPSLSGNYTADAPTAFSEVVLYSYQTGDWENPNSWTEDPSGTTLVNPRVPGTNAPVYILNGDVIRLNSNITTTGHSLVIQGTLDLRNYSLPTLTGLSGQGTLRLNSSQLPAVANNSFYSTGQGTVEVYNFDGNLLSLSNTFNNLWLTKDDNNTNQYVYTIGGNLLINGDLRIRNTPNQGKTTLMIGGSGASNITVLGRLINGDASRANTDMMAISLTGAFFQHFMTIYGDFTNHGAVDFSNNAQYSATTTQTFKLIFRGASNNAFLCNGPTDIYDLDMIKGTDRTFVLTLSAIDPTYFRAFSNGEIFNMTGNGSNRGTLKLGNNIIMSRVNLPGQNFEVGTTANGSVGLWIDGASINTSQALVPYGQYRITSGNVTIGGEGLVLRMDGEIVIEGGITTIEKLRTSTNYGEIPRGSFIISGGVLNVNPLLVGGSSNTNFPQFCMPYPDQVFIMSGGTINITS